MSTASISGIICEDYKVERFETALKKADFKYTIAKFMPGIKIIKVQFFPRHFMELQFLIKSVEEHFAAMGKGNTRYNILLHQIIRLRKIYSRLPDKTIRDHVRLNRVARLVNERVKEVEEIAKNISK
jgi:hypothetical protein